MPEGRHEKHDSRDTCDQEHRAQLATPVDGEPTTTTAAGWTKTWLWWVISEYFYQSDKKKYVFWLILLKNTCAYSFMWIAIHWVCHIDTYRSDKITVHRDAPVNLYTLITYPLCGEDWSGVCALIQCKDVLSISNYGDNWSPKITPSPQMHSGNSYTSKMESLYWIWPLNYWEKSLSANKYFRTWVLIGCQLCCQPIRSQVWKFLSTDMDSRPLEVPALT